MKKTFIFLLLNLFVGAVFAQFSDKKVKYDEVLPQILDLPSAGKPILLKEFQVENPDDISIDFQLGIVYLERFINSNILTEFAYKNGNARNALVFLKKSRMIIDEKEIKKNQDLYINFGYYDDRGKPRVEYDTINTVMSTYIPILEEFVEKAPPIYESFTKSFTHYDKAHKLYTGLVGEYPTYNDLLLLFNDEIDQTFEEMKSEYNNAIESFKVYKSLIQEYDIGYNQELDITELGVYRLDGLSAEINFLLDEIEVWDYASWVDETRAYTAQNVDGLRNDLIAEDIRSDQVLAATRNDFQSDEFQLLDISKELLFTLRKFDLQSVIESIFMYKEVKHDLMYQELLSQQLESDTTIDESRKLYLYGQMIKKIVNSDTLLSNITARNNPSNHAKYGDFLEERYEGESGVNEFVAKERETNSSDYNSYVGQVRNMLFDILEEDTVMESITYKRENYPLISENPVFAESMEGPMTTHRIDNFDGSAFIGGTKKNADGILVGYIGGVTAAGRMSWLKEFSLKSELSEEITDTRLGTMQLIPGGVAAVLNINDLQMGVQQNILVILDGGGEEQLNIPMIQTDFPRTITYIERSNSLLVTFKGEDFQKDILKNNALTIASYNILGDLHWTQSLEYKGDVVDVIPVFDGYVVVGNYNQIKGLDERLIRTGGTNTQTYGFLSKISNEGQFLALKPLESSGAYFINKPYKISDDCINLFGKVGNYNPDANFESGPDYVHMILDFDLKILSNSL